MRQSHPDPPGLVTTTTRADAWSGFWSVWTPGLVDAHVSGAPPETDENDAPQLAA